MFKSTKMAAPPPRVKVKNAIVSLLLVAALVITGALAFLTAKDSAENKFTVGNVEITLTEPLWDAANPDGTLENIVAGQVITKDPTITNTGVNNAYVYMMVQVPKADNIAIDGEVVSDHQLFSFTPNTGWKCIAEKTDDNDANNYYLYAFNTALAPEGTANLFDKVIFANTTSDFEASSLKIEIEAYAIQSDFYNGEATDAESAWNLYVNQSGWAFPSVDAPVVVPEGMSALNFVDEDGDVVHTEIAEVGTPVTMYFEPSLAKTGYAFDWVDEDTGDVAYSGMPMPEEDTNLAASYTEIENVKEATIPSYFKYKVSYDEKTGYTASIIGTITNAVDFPKTTTDVIVPSHVTVTGDGTLNNLNISCAESTYCIYNLSTVTTAINGTITVPVVGVENNAFADIKDVTRSIVFPDTITFIGSPDAFYGQSVNNGSVFHPINTQKYGSTALTKVHLSYGLQRIGYGAFRGCTNLSEINFPKSLTQIDQFAFCNTGFTEMIVPKHITDLNDAAFMNSTKIKTVTVENGVTELSDSLFSGCTALTNVVLPETLTKIGASAFRETTSLKSIDLPDSLNSLGYYAFLMSGLTSIDIPDNVEIIEMSAFGDCNALKTVVLPTNLKTIDSSAFTGTAISTITLPANCETIDFSVFESCTNLTSIYMYNNIKSIGIGAFYNTPLTNVYYSGTEAEWNAISIASSNNTPLFNATKHYNCSF